jgi:hypothetical protein
MLLFYRENGVAKNVCMQLVYKMLLIKRGVTTVAAVVRVNFPFVKNSISFRVEGLFVPRPVVDLNCVSAFNLWASHKKTHFYS